MIDTVLFDFDGTLMDTNNVIIQSWQHTFRTLEGREESLDRLVPTFGEPLETTMKKFFPEQPLEEAMEVYRGFQREYFTGLIDLFDGVEEMIRDIRAAGYKVGVVTSRLVGTTMAALEKFGIKEAFDTIITPEDTSKHKPDPEPILIAVERLGSVPEHTVMVGDTMFDILCARNAKVTSILVGWTFALEGVTDFGDAAPDHRISHPSDLLPLLERL